LSAPRITSPTSTTTLIRVTGCARSAERGRARRQGLSQRPLHIARPRTRTRDVTAFHSGGRDG
jgi:hypothetical protein